MRSAPRRSWSSRWRWCTVLAPEIGYEKAAAIAKEAYETGRTVREVAREKSGIPEDAERITESASQAGRR